MADRFHRQGIATLLLRRLFAAALQRKVKQMVFELLAENRAMEALVRKLAPAVESHLEGPVLTLRVQLATEAL